MVYMALPSPISATTGRSGSASLTPIAAGRPQPMPPPRRPKKLCGSSLLMSWRMPGAEDSDFLDHDGILRQHLADGVQQRQRLHRRPAGQRARLGAECLAVLLDRLAARISAARGRRSGARATCARRRTAVISGSVLLDRRGSRPSPDSSCRSPTGRCRDGRSAFPAASDRRSTAATGEQIGADREQQVVLVEHFAHAGLRARHHAAKQRMRRRKRRACSA